MLNIYGMTFVLCCMSGLCVPALHAGPVMSVMRKAEKRLRTQDVSSFFEPKDTEKCQQLQQQLVQPAQHVQSTQLDNPDLFSLICDVAVFLSSYLGTT